MGKFLPPKLTTHEALSAAERAYLQGLELPTVTFLKYKSLVTGILARRVENYRDDMPDNDPVTDGMDLLTNALNSAAHLYEPEELQQTRRAAELAKATSAPGKLLNILIRLDAETRRRSKERAFGNTTLNGQPLTPERLQQLRKAA